MYSSYKGKKMKAIVVGTGAGGATAARELSAQGFKVTILEAGGHSSHSEDFYHWQHH